MAALRRDIVWNRFGEMREGDGRRTRVVVRSIVRKKHDRAFMTVLHCGWLCLCLCLCDCDCDCRSFSKGVGCARDDDDDDDIICSRCVFSLLFWDSSINARLVTPLKLYTKPNHNMKLFPVPFPVPQVWILFSK